MEIGINCSEFPNVWRLWNDGFSLSWIAREYGVSVSCVSAVAEKLLKDPKLRIAEPADVAIVVKDDDTTVGDCILKPHLLERYRVGYGAVTFLSSIQ
jgi:hypothetical protein